MRFDRKRFSDAAVVILSEKPTFASTLEEQLSTVLPALESNIDSFESYLTAYEHCAEKRNVGFFFLHESDHNTMPDNSVEELSKPYEGLGAVAGFVVVAENESVFARAYKKYGNTPGLLNIVLESQLTKLSSLLDLFVEAWSKFERLQKNVALSEHEIQFLSGIASRFGSPEFLLRTTNLLTYRLDKNWLDTLVVEAAPILLSIPEPQRWIVNNSKSLKRILSMLDPFLKMTAEELISSKDEYVVVRGCALATIINTASVNGVGYDLIESLTKNASSFSPALKKALNAEKQNILDLVSDDTRRKAA